MEIIEYRGCKIRVRSEIYQDPFNPRHNDNLTHIVAWDSNNNFGDENIPCSRCGIESAIEELKPIAVGPFALSVYEHSGIVLSICSNNDPWDSRISGFVVVTRERVEQLIGWKRLTAKRKAELVSQAKSEIETYSEYINGNVFRYTVISPDGEVIGSQHGFCGLDHEKSGLLPNARDDVDRWLNWKQREAWTAFSNREAELALA